MPPHLLALSRWCGNRGVVIIVEEAVRVWGGVLARVLGWLWWPWWGVGVFVCAGVPVVGEAVKLFPEFAEEDEAGWGVTVLRKGEAVDGSVAGFVAYEELFYAGVEGVVGWEGSARDEDDFLFRRSLSWRWWRFKPSFGWEILCWD